MNANELGEETRQKAEAELHEAAQKLTEAGQEWGEKAKSAARHAGAAADLYLHEYAWTSMVLVAAAAGMLGYLVGARRH